MGQELLQGSGGEACPGRPPGGPGSAHVRWGQSREGVTEDVTPAGIHLSGSVCHGCGQHCPIQEEHTWMHVTLRQKATTATPLLSQPNRTSRVAKEWGLRFTAQSK